MHTRHLGTREARHSGRCTGDPGSPRDGEQEALPGNEAHRPSGSIRLSGAPDRTGIQLAELPGNVNGVAVDAIRAESQRSGRMGTGISIPAGPAAAQRQSGPETGGSLGSQERRDIDVPAGSATRASYDTIAAHLPDRLGSARLSGRLPLRRPSARVLARAAFPRAHRQATSLALLAGHARAADGNPAAGRLPGIGSAKDVFLRALPPLRLRDSARCARRAPVVIGEKRAHQ
jgi:hypothetical protein